MTTATRSIALVIVLLAGCKKHSRQGHRPEASARADAAVVDAMAVDADPFGALPAIEDIPAITLAPATGHATSAAKKLAGDALKRHLAGDLTGAVPIYMQALAKDPGHLMARYNLASAYARLGQHGRALALLKQFKDLNCAVCLGRLARSRKDRDWESLWQDPTFAALTERTLVPSPDRVAVTLLLAQAFRSGDARPIADLLHPRDSIEVTISPYECDHDMACDLGEAWQTDSVTGAAELTRWLRSTGRSRIADSRASCSDDCCELIGNEWKYTTQHMMLWAVCFHTDSGGATFPDRIMAIGDPGQDW